MLVFCFFLGWDKYACVQIQLAETHHAKVDFFTNFIQFLFAEIWLVLLVQLAERLRGVEIRKLEGKRAKFFETKFSGKYVHVGTDLKAVDKDIACVECSP